MSDFRESDEKTKSLGDLFATVTQIQIVYLLLSILLVGLTLFLIYLKIQSEQEYYAAFLIVSTTLLTLSFFHGRVLFRNSVRIREIVESRLEKSQEDLTKTIKKYLEPSIWTLTSNEAVIQQAATALNRAAKEELQPDRFVYIFGAAALSIPRSTSDEAEASDPAAGYRNALAELARTHTPIDRYINLFDERSFSLRSESVRVQYLDWLNRQITAMKENVGYRIWRTIRAGEWGSARSTIVTRHHVLDIVGDGRSGFFITGRDVAHLVQQQTIEHIQSARLNKPESYDQERLSKYRDKILEAHKKKSHKAKENAFGGASESPEETST